MLLRVWSPPESKARGSPSQGGTFSNCLEIIRGTIWAPLSNKERGNWKRLLSPPSAFPGEGATYPKAKGSQVPSAAFLNTFTPTFTAGLPRTASRTLTIRGHLDSPAPWVERDKSTRLLRLTGCILGGIRSAARQAGHANPISCHRSVDSEWASLTWGHHTDVIISQERQVSAFKYAALDRACVMNLKRENRPSVHSCFVKPPLLSGITAGVIWLEDQILFPENILLRSYCHHCLLLVVVK